MTSWPKPAMSRRADVLNTPAPQHPPNAHADPSPLVYLAPSGVQKERILAEHMFVLPFAQSSVPKPGSKRDFVRVPSKKVSRGWGWD